MKIPMNHLVMTLEIRLGNCVVQNVELWFFSYDVFANFYHCPKLRTIILFMILGCITDFVNVEAQKVVLFYSL